MSEATAPPSAATPRTPAAADAGAIVVFDGVCVLCNGWVGFLAKRDRRRRYRFAPMQGETGRGLLAGNGLNPDDPLSFLLIEFDRASRTRAVSISPASAHLSTDPSRHSNTQSEENSEPIDAAFPTPAARVSTESTAVIRVLTGLGGVWRVFGLALALPRAVRDPLYRMVARNRYRWFGRHAACVVPDPEDAWRFL